MEITYFTVIKKTLNQTTTKLTLLIYSTKNIFWKKKIDVSS